MTDEALVDRMALPRPMLPLPKPRISFFPTTGFPARCPNSAASRTATTGSTRKTAAMC